MTMFDERERAFENLFVHEEELRFLALARRNQLFARWAAEQMGLRGPQLNEYVRSFTTSAVRSEPEHALVDRVRADFIAEGVDTPERSIEAALSVAAAAAARQVRTEARVQAG
ncbi:DUF1476 domain-containing protein [Microvirga aerophila]|uniref:Aldolase n=1 Tax=Microvirga aerophila TaxID=670291 RepID=A0A512C4K4_9HYPH|nr:DUF1476 domain-containing protein [Microvirga aerophila]GEO19129.1 hypothetical protein MAE02_68250 [Microvirga aerophila]